MRPYIGAGVDIATVLAVTRLLAYILNDRDRFRRLLVLVFLALAVIAVRWALADGGVHIILHDFGLSTTQPGSPRAVASQHVDLAQ